MCRKLQFRRDDRRKPAAIAGLPRNGRSARAGVLKEGSDATIIVYGALAESVITASEILAEDGISVEIVDARFCKPIDGDMLARALVPGRAVLTVEDHSLQNGFGTAVVEYAVSHNLPTASIVRLGMPDRLISHATRKEQLTEIGLDPKGIAASVRDAIKAAQRAGAPVVTVSINKHLELPKAQKLTEQTAV